MIILIHEMITDDPVPVYHRYLTHSPESEPWGLAVTAAGKQSVLPGTPYPPRGHPLDHAFSWDAGRVLPSCQVVFIRQGGGRFESRATGLKSIEAGTGLIVLPGIWHRYAPDPAFGWVEHWVELRGPVIDSLVRHGALTPKRAILRIDHVLELTALFQKVYTRMAPDAASAFDPQRSALGLQILALVVAETEGTTSESPLSAALGRAERLLADTMESPPAMTRLARQLGIGYSHFRREFKRRTGLSPHRYLNQLRLEKGRRLIGATEESFKAIAEQLGFSSAYHFSTAFKRHFGVSPRGWRQRTRRGMT